MPDTLPKLPDHPEPHTYTWTALELEALERYGAECKAAEAARWKAALDPVMPSDFKDWHQNAMAERPEIAAWVISNLRERLAEAERANAECRRQALEDAAREVDNAIGEAIAGHFNKQAISALMQTREMLRERAEKE